MKQFNTRLPERLITAIKIRSLEVGKSIEKTVTELIEHGLKRKPKNRK